MSVAPDSIPGEQDIASQPAVRPLFSVVAEIVAWLILLAVNGWLHFWRLAERTFHHDEVLHAYYSWFIQEYGSYTYNPMMHGPSQLYLAAWIAPFFTPDGLGGDRIGMRALAAICGTLLPLSLLFFRIPQRSFVERQLSLSPAFALLAAGWIVTSAPLLYYGRFFRNDIPFLFLSMLTLGLWYRGWSIFRSPRNSEKISANKAQKQYSLTAAICLCTSFCVLGLHFAFKENAIIFTFILCVYALLWTFANKVNLAGFKKIIIYLTPMALAGLGIAALWGLLVFSDFTRRPDGPISVLQRTLDYWVEQNKKQRLGGPFHYYIHFLGTYHLFALFTVVALSLYRLFKPLGAKVLALGGAISGAFIMAFVFDYLLLPPSAKKVLWNIFHVDGLLHFTLGACVFFWAVWATWERLRAGQPLHAFWIHWTLWSWMIYSYAGEKVPWLSVYIVLPMLIWAALEALILLEAMQQSPKFLVRFGLKWVMLGSVAAALCLSAVNCWRANFIYYSNPREILVYNHTSGAFQDAVDGIITLAEGEAEISSLKIGFSGDAGWPLHYDLRNISGASTFEPEDFSTAKNDTHSHEFDLLILDNQRSLPAKISQQFEWVDVPFRQYWIPPKWPLPIQLGWASWRPPSERSSEYLLGGQNGEEPIKKRELLSILWRYFAHREPFYKPDAPSYAWGAGPHAHTVSIGISQNLLQRSSAARAFWSNLGASVLPYENFDASLELN